MYPLDSLAGPKKERKKTVPPDNNAEWFWLSNHWSFVIQWGALKCQAWASAAPAHRVWRSDPNLDFPE